MGPLKARLPLLPDSRGPRGRRERLAYAGRDAIPVTLVHTLVIPKRHAPNYFGLGRPELNACHRLLEQEK